MKTTTNERLEIIRSVNKLRGQAFAIRNKFKSDWLGYTHDIANGELDSQEFTVNAHLNSICREIDKLNEFIDFYWNKEKEQSER